MVQKEIAVRCLEMLDIYKPYIRKFKSKAGVPCFFENYGGFYADQEEKLWAKIKEIEDANLKIGEYEKLKSQLTVAENFENIYELKKAKYEELLKKTEERISSLK